MYYCHSDKEGDKNILDVLLVLDLGNSWRIGMLFTLKVTSARFMREEKSNFGKDQDGHKYKRFLTHFHEVSGYEDGYS